MSRLAKSSLSVAALFGAACPGSAQVLAQVPEEAGASSSSAPPLSARDTWLTTADYPLGALRRGEEGVVRFEVGIGVDGEPTRCEIVQSSGYPELDSQTCTMLMLRARFRPAMQAGKPVESSWRSSVRWMIPPTPETAPPAQEQGDLPAADHKPLDIVPGEASAQFVIGVDGRAADCQVARSGAPYKLIKPVLALCWRGQSFVPAHDAVRRPVKRTVKVRIVVETEDLPSDQGPVTP